MLCQNYTYIKKKRLIMKILSALLMALFIGSIPIGAESFSCMAEPEVLEVLEKMNRERALGNLSQRKLRFSIKNKYLGCRREGDRTIVLVLRTQSEEGEIIHDDHIKDGEMIDDDHKRKQWYQLDDKLISRRVLSLIIEDLNA